MISNEEHTGAHELVISKILIGRRTGISFLKNTYCKLVKCQVSLLKMVSRCYSHYL